MLWTPPHHLGFALPWGRFPPRLACCVPTHLVVRVPAIIQHRTHTHLYHAFTVPCKTLINEMSFVRHACTSARDFASLTSSKMTACEMQVTAKVLGLPTGEWSSQFSAAKCRPHRTLLFAPAMEHRTICCSSAECCCAPPRTVHTRDCT